MKLKLIIVTYIHDKGKQNKTFCQFHMQELRHDDGKRCEMHGLFYYHLDTPQIQYSLICCHKYNPINQLIHPTKTISQLQNKTQSIDLTCQ
uniref:Uncharacterized protein n=1 Tax=Cannabis sativa TaxID=3483 RepID=A0A803QX06_CANSA